ncbi:MAG: hypothetical protein NC117_06165 [Pseudoflavonifractor sp.]|nr:hypothetical protein [Pseudoflavonifractor sp.]
MTPMPQQFLDMLARHPEFDGLADALTSDPVVSVRLNPRKIAFPGPDAATVPWCPTGRYLADKIPFTFDPAMHQGLYYVQDASSMIVGTIAGRLAADMPSPVYLDACAAPGGKTTAVIDSLPDDSLIVANEFVRSRAAVLRENIIKWGTPSAIVTTGDTARLSLLRGRFDIIGADVPCSGEGMMRKDHTAVSQWCPALVTECAARQREIVTNLWPALRPGGYMIYSTCTFNREENEEMVAYMARTLGAVPVDMGLTSYPGISAGIDTPYPCYRFMPHRLRGEGLFVAVLQKPDDANGDTDGNHRHKDSPATARQGKASRRGRDKTPAIPSSVTGMVDDSRDWTLLSDNGVISAFPTHGLGLLADARRNLDVIHAGITLAAAKGRDLIPSQSIALSTALRPGVWPTVEVDYPTAIAYLRRESITLPDDQRGIVLLTYRDRPLGFAKNLGNRANNLYPADWRILSTHTPATPISLIPDGLNY